MHPAAHTELLLFSPPAFVVAPSFKSQGAGIRPDPDKSNRAGGGGMIGSRRGRRAALTPAALPEGGVWSGAGELPHGAVSCFVWGSDSLPPVSIPLSLSSRADTPQHRMETRGPRPCRALTGCGTDGRARPARLGIGGLAGSRSSPSAPVLLSITRGSEVESGGKRRRKRLKGDRPAESGVRAGYFPQDPLRGENGPAGCTP